MTLILKVGLKILFPYMNNRIDVPCPPCVEGIQDELVLAVTFLEMLGFSMRQLNLKYQLNKNTLSKLIHGGKLTRNRKKYRLMLELALHDASVRASNSGGKITHVRNQTLEKFVFTENDIRSVTFRFHTIIYS